MRTRMISSRSAVMRKLAEPALTSMPSRRGCELVTASSVMAGCEATRLCAWAGI